MKVVSLIGRRSSHGSATPGNSRTRGGPWGASQFVRAPVTLAAARATLEDFAARLTKTLGELEVSFARPSWDQYFMDIARTVAARSNCMKRQVAAVIVSDRRIISTGYNGTPRGVKNCNEGGCPRCNGFSESGRNLEECLCSHGEENAIVQASYHGIAIRDATLYTTYSPCLMCSKMIINAGIRRVVYNEAYPLNDTATAMLREAGVDLVKLRV